MPEPVLDVCTSRSTARRRWAATRPPRRSKGCSTAPTPRSPACSAPQPSEIAFADERDAGLGHGLPRGAARRRRSHRHDAAPSTRATPCPWAWSWSAPAPRWWSCPMTSRARSTSPPSTRSSTGAGSGWWRSPTCRRRTARSRRSSRDRPPLPGRRRALPPRCLPVGRPAAGRRRRDRLRPARRHRPQVPARAARHRLPLRPLRASSTGSTPPFLDLRAATWTGPFTYELHPDARRFEQWERSVAGHLGLGAAVDHLLGWGIDDVQARVTALAEHLRAALDGGRASQVHDVGPVRSGIVTFTVDGRPAGRSPTTWRRPGVNCGCRPAEDSHLDLLPRGSDHRRRAGCRSTTTTPSTSSTGPWTWSRPSPDAHTLLTPRGPSFSAEGARPEHTRSTMFTRKLIASTVAAATLATGGLTVAALNPLASAGAEEQASARHAAGPPDPRPAHPRHRARRASWPTAPSPRRRPTRSRRG